MSGRRGRRGALTAAEKKDQQKAGVRFCCYVDTTATGEPPPNDCVLDYGARGDCVFAQRRKAREACRYWQPAMEPEP